MLKDPVPKTLSSRFIKSELKKVPQSQTTTNNSLIDFPLNQYVG